MCEANAYLIGEDGSEKLLLESVDLVTPQDDGLLLQTIFGERQFVKGKIKYLALVDHRIVVEKN